MAINDSGFLARAEEDLKVFKEKYSRNTKFFIPWKMDNYKGLVFGYDIQNNIKHRITFDNQYFEKLEPKTRYVELFNSMFHDPGKVIILFPRSRAARRPDKNWTRDSYDRLIELLKNAYGDYQIFVAGDGIGSYYGDKCPDGCQSLIHVDRKIRQGLQLVALNSEVVPEIRTGS